MLLILVHIDLSPEYEVEICSLVALPNNLLLFYVESRLHEHSHEHDLVLVGLQKYVKVADPLIVHVLYHLVAHFRVDEVKELV